MEKNPPRYTLSTLAALLEGEPEGPSDLPLNKPVSAGENDPLGVTFAENEEYLARAEASDVGAVIVARDQRASSKPLIRVDHPRLGFGMLLHISIRPLPLNEGIHPTAIISDQAQVDPTAQVGPYAIVERGSRIGAHSKIYPYCYVGEDCELGEKCVLYPHVVLYQEVRLGNYSVIHSGSVLGADGFGYLWDGSKHVKIPQIGAVVLGNSVEVGANTTIDRSTTGATSIGDGTKIDNLVQIAHNVNIGRDAILAGQCGISGSVNIGDRVIMAGNVVSKDHVDIASDTSFGGRAGIDRDITEPGPYFGTPARPAAEGIRSFRLITKLPEIMSRLRAVEKKVTEKEKDAK